ncbi:condensation domain-containing protein, partial [uncultured Shewanella sp.]|uniref:condensation domain-containing protein n=1 Tax=uncultured Shewanella sp. TaxID=173975 RepID=UPI00261C566D
RLQPDTDVEVLLASINMIAMRHPVLNSVYQQTGSVAIDGARNSDSSVRNSEKASERSEASGIHTCQLDEPLSYQRRRLSDVTELTGVVQAEIATPFMLTEQAPIRLCLYDIPSQANEKQQQSQHTHQGNNESERYLLLMFHHIAFDGWSMDILFNELFECYQSLLDDRA